MVIGYAARYFLELISLEGPGAQEMYAVLDIFQMTSPDNFAPRGHDDQT